MRQHGMGLGGRAKAGRSFAGGMRGAGGSDWNCGPLEGRTEEWAWRVTQADAQQQQGAGLQAGWTDGVGRMK